MNRKEQKKIRDIQAAGPGRRTKEQSLKKGNSLQILKHLFAYMQGSRGLLLLSLLLALASVILSLLIPILTGEGIDCIVGKGRVDFSELRKILTWIGLCIAGSAISQWCMNHLNNTITFRLCRDLRKDAFDHLHRLPLAYLDAHSSGDLISRIMTDVEQISDGLLLGFSQFFTGVATILGTIFFMVRLNLWVALLVIAMTPLSFLVARFLSRKTHHYFTKQSEARGDQTAFSNEMLTGLRTLQAFGQEENVISIFQQKNEILAGYSMKATFFSSLPNPTTRFVNAIIYVGVTLLGCLSCFYFGGPAMTIGNLSSFLSYTSQFARPFNDITGIITEFQNSIASAERVFDLLSQQGLQELPDAADLSVTKGHVIFDRVSFSYAKDKPFIRDLSFYAKAGQHIAIVGPTGCGKTTLVNLLMRFYELDGGSITLDGTDTRKILRPSLRSQVGMVLQDTWLRSGTIRENIAYGKPDATEEEIRQAAHAANADFFIEQMEHGYDTVLEEDGGNLSQGQRQLLCLSRLMLCLPPLLILDEATSSIDTVTEVQIQSAFDRMMQGRTCFIVAHRLSTIQAADCILVMKDGAIIQKGTHEELLARGGFYADLYYSQYSV